MHRIAVIFESSPFDRKGLFNAVHNRILHLKNTGECEVDVFCIHSWDTTFTRRMRHTPYVEERCPSYQLDGIEYNMFWYDFSIIDHMTVEKLHRRPFFFTRFMKKNVSRYSGYDMIMAHSFTGGLMALEAFRTYGIPYMVTWHGSDVHTHPWRNPLVLDATREVMENAACNCFVSRALLNESERIISGVRKEVLHNGVSDAFMKFSDEQRESLRKGYGVLPGDKIVAFVGSIVEVKNVRSLPAIFHAIRSRYDGNVKFWMVGDGKLRNAVEPAMLSDETIAVRFWGNVPADEMPSVMNCIDVMLLPSFNEGLPLVCAEAVRCGAKVVGSNVGGIPEMIGCESVVSHGEGFVEAMAVKAVDMLDSDMMQTVPDSMDWTATSIRELSIIRSVLS